MAGQGRLSGPALLRCHSQNAHSLPLTNMGAFDRHLTAKPLNIG
jgi:hypothetical protein